MMKDADRFEIISSLKKLSYPASIFWVLPLMGDNHSSLDQSRSWPAIRPRFGYKGQNPSVCMNSIYLRFTVRYFLDQTALFISFYGWCVCRLSCVFSQPNITSTVLVLSKCQINQIITYFEIILRGHDANKNWSLQLHLARHRAIFEVSLCGIDSLQNSTKFLEQKVDYMARWDIKQCGIHQTPKHTMPPSPVVEIKEKWRFLPRFTSGGWSWFELTRRDQSKSIDACRWLDIRTLLGEGIWQGSDRPEPLYVWVKSCLWLNRTRSFVVYVIHQ